MLATAAVVLKVKLLQRQAAISLKAAHTVMQRQVGAITNKFNLQGHTLKNPV
jgi:hypothetical protein